jgi:hypothetical protein
MTTSGLFRVDLQGKTLNEVEEIDLASLGLKERYDLQEWIDKRPEILGEELLVISKECNSFDSTSERADLIAVDKLGNLVVVELKRDDSGANVHWQAIKYASYFARAKPDVLVELLAKYAQLSIEDAKMRLLGFIGQDDLSALNREQRVILACHRFAREVTSAVLWLRDHGVDISCVQLTPFRDAVSKAVYMQATTIIPVPGTDGYVVTAESPTVVVPQQSGRGKKDDDVTAFLRRISDETASKLVEAHRPDKTSRWAGVYGTMRYFNMWYRHAPWQPYAFQYKLTIVDEKDGGRALSVGLEVMDNAALKAGLTDVQLATLKNSMKLFSEASNGTLQQDPGKWTWCGFVVPAPVFDDVLHSRGVVSLQRVIEHFTPSIEKLFESVNEQES